MKKRYVFEFSPDVINIPVTYELIKNYDVKVNILNADLASGKGGKLFVELSAEESKMEKGLDYVTNNGVICYPIIKQLHFDEESCVDCGSCVSVCFSQALVLDKSKKLIFKPENCVICGLCVKACPLQLFSLDND